MQDATNCWICGRGISDDPLARIVTSIATGSVRFVCGRPECTDRICARIGRGATELGDDAISQYLRANPLIREVALDWDCTLSTMTKLNRQRGDMQLLDHSRYLAASVRQWLHRLHAAGYRLSVVSYAYEPRIVESLRAAGITADMIAEERVLTMDDFAEDGHQMPKQDRHRLVPKSRMMDELRRRLGVADKRRYVLVDDNPDNIEDMAANGYAAFEVPVCPGDGGACRSDDRCPGIAGLL